MVDHQKMFSMEASKDLGVLNCSPLWPTSSQRLTLELWLHNDRIATPAIFGTRTIEPWFVQQMIARLSVVMNQLTRALPTQTLSDLETCAPSDFEQSWEWNKAVPAEIEEYVFVTFSKGRFNSTLMHRPSSPGTVLCPTHNSTTYRLESLRYSFRWEWRTR
jgi:hypothetical protein